VAGFSEHGNEYRGTVHDWNFTTSLTKISFKRKKTHSSKESAQIALLQPVFRSTSTVVEYQL
jgi:hypothetical protein